MPVQYIVNDKSLQKSTVYGYRADGVRVVLGHRLERITNVHKIVTPSRLARRSTKCQPALIEQRTYKDFGTDKQPVQHPHLPTGFIDYETFLLEEWYEGSIKPKMEEMTYRHIVEYTPPTCVSHLYPLSKAC